MKLTEAKASLGAAVHRADAADTCAAPLRASENEARRVCAQKEEEAKAMADRLAVARMAHKQAMAALKEVGLRLEYDRRRRRRG
jgi:hypothetical protein